jgi:hypothetical protein
MRERSGPKRPKVRGKRANVQFAEGMGNVVRETTRLWRKHHLAYDQIKFPPRSGVDTVDCDTESGASSPES